MADEIIALGDATTTPNVTPRITDEVLAAHGVERFADWRGQTRFVGTRDGLVETGVVPVGQPFPGDEHAFGLRGERYVDHAGRRTVVSKQSRHRRTFSVSVYPTKSEQAEYDRQSKVDSERRAAVRFLLEFAFDDRTPNLRMYEHPRAPAPSQEITDCERLSLSWTELERFAVSTLDPIHHAREAIAAAMRNGGNALRRSADLYRAIDDLCYGLAVHTDADDRKVIVWSIIRLRELSGWTEAD